MKKRDIFVIFRFLVWVVGLIVELLIEIRNIGGIIGGGKCWG